MSLITVIGRGHSGTRAMSHTLSESGVYMGEPLNVSGDLLPPQAMYEACRVFARHVRWLGGLEWDWSAAFTLAESCSIPHEFTDLIHEYLKVVLASDSEHKGWKIPETTLVYPWIQRMFPDARYVFWIRNPRDCILGRHLTDDLADFGVPYGTTDDLRLRRAISWMYQYKLVKTTPRPRYWMEVRLEDFILRQPETLARLENFLGIPMATIPVKPEVIDRWKVDPEPSYYDFFEPAMVEYGYAAPAPVVEE